MKKYKQYKYKNLPIALTFSFRMGWNNHSSDTIYDSISGHVLKISYLSKKMIDACISNKMCLTCSKIQQIDEESFDHIYPKNL